MYYKCKINLLLNKYLPINYVKVKKIIYINFNFFKKNYKNKNPQKKSKDIYVYMKKF